MTAEQEKQPSQFIFSHEMFEASSKALVQIINEHYEALKNLPTGLFSNSEKQKNEILMKEVREAIDIVLGMLPVEYRPVSSHQRVLQVLTQHKEHQTLGIARQAQYLLGAIISIHEIPTHIPSKSE